MRKGEIACYKQFLLFTQYFLQIYIFTASKCGNGLKLCYLVKLKKKGLHFQLLQKFLKLQVVLNIKNANRVQKKIILCTIQKLITVKLVKSAVNSCRSFLEWQIKSAADTRQSLLQIVSV